MTQTESLYQYLKGQHGLSLWELADYAKRAWTDSRSKNIRANVSKCLSAHCSDCPDYKGREDLFYSRGKGRDRRWFVRKMEK